ncbi:hypothetical protein ABZX40_22670 [Streptomyces sp. NPDC004610]|uniref:hypothetical protein n=1 Tax=unclassified Streptomyces TaxID=2593676 RepID=UPI0033BD85A5
MTTTPISRGANPHKEEESEPPLLSDRLTTWARTRHRGELAAVTALLQEGDLIARDDLRALSLGDHMTGIFPHSPRDAVELLPLPPIDTLTADQIRGAVCLWDPTEDPLTPDTAVDLHARQARIRWFPRACSRHTGRQAYRLLLDHAPRCDRCIRDAGICGTGIARRRLIREGRRPDGGSEPPA